MCADFSRTGVQRKQKDKTVIAHISDLHFTSTTDFTNDERWLALAQALERNRPDILAVTGDLIDSSISDSNDLGRIESAFETVYQYLTKTLCSSAQIDSDQALFVVPGNHDYRLKGLIWRKPLFDLFHDRFKAYFHHSILWQLKVVIFVFDSNPRELGLNLATGLISERDLISFSGAAENLARAEPDVWYSTTRIALLHHHPMPIAATEHRERLTDREEFLLLKNAGLFMNEMVRSEIDLILHGHKHYPSFSRASFPALNFKEHGIAVVGAGSVGKGDLPHRSYNLIKIEESGEVSLERRSCPAATYEGSARIFLRPYADARQVVASRLADKTKVKLRARKYTRLDLIKAGSGDDYIHEQFESVESYSGAPVPEVEHSVSSKSGRFPERLYETDVPNQRIGWKWLDPPSVGPVRRAITTFDPPISTTPITFRRKGPITNAVYFNQRDRLDATDQQSLEESVSATIKQWNDLFVFQVSFPKGFFPSNFKLQVTNNEGARDYREETFALPYFSVFQDLRTAVLTVERPLPGYNYKIVWSLPVDEIDELSLTAAQRGYAEEMIGRLLRLRVSECPYGIAIDGHLKRFCEQLVESGVFRSPTGEDDWEIALFVYDRSKSGLVCVAALGDYTPESKIWAWVVKTGKGVLGQAYKRQSDVTWVGLRGVSDESGPYERTDDREPHSVVSCMPILYPLRGGRRVAVLSLASRSNTSGLLRLETDEAAKMALKAQSIVWFATSVVPALGLAAAPELLGENH